MKRRQKIRKAILIITFLFFPMLLNFFSPFLSMWGASLGIISGSLLIFLSLFFSAIFTGRAFCSWVCPTAGLQRALFLGNNKKIKRNKWTLSKYVIWIPWFSFMVIFFIKARGIKSIDFLFMTPKGISLDQPFKYIIFYSVLLIITVLSLIIGRRAFCHYGCWIAPFMELGQKLGRLLRLPSLKLKVHSEKCIQCSQCTKICVKSLEVKEMVLQKEINHKECILCGECVDICPKGAIQFTFGKRNKIK